MGQKFSIIEAGQRWVNPDGTPTQYFFRLFNNIVTAVGPAVALGGYSPIFQSGYVVYTGAGSSFQANIAFEFGTNIPNPSGVPGAALLLGSGGGKGIPATTWIISDQAYDALTPGNTLGITAGETQASGIANGGLLWLIGGASFGGTGGELLLQGGTSLNGPGGMTILQGGNSTHGIPGDVFVSAGQNGTQGANVQLIATEVNGLPGSIIFRINSTQLYEFESSGAIFIGPTAGVGLPGQAFTSGGPGEPVTWAQIPAGVTGEIQYNDAGVLGATSGLTYTVATNTLGVVSEILTGAFSDQSYATVVAVAAGTVTAADAINSMLLNPAGTIATFAITMPANPIDGQIFELSSTQTVSTLTMTANAAQIIQGSAVAGSITIASFGVTSGASWRWILALTQWVRRY